MKNQVKAFKNGKFEIKVMKEPLEELYHVEAMLGGEMNELISFKNIGSYKAASKLFDRMLKNLNNAMDAK